MSVISPIIGRDAFLEQIPVSRETQDRLDQYVALLVKWQKAINLVGPKTIESVWTRHLLDCAQVLPLIPRDARSVMDMGSGAGLPGLILAILGGPPNGSLDVHLFESDLRKATFLQEAARETGTIVTVHNQRIEKTESRHFDVICARAFAPIEKILKMGQPFSTENTVFLLPKGQNVEDELTAAHKIWSFSSQRHQSLTDADATVLMLSEVRYVPPASCSG